MLHSTQKGAAPKLKVEYNLSDVRFSHRSTQDYGR